MVSVHDNVQHLLQYGCFGTAVTDPLAANQIGRAAVVCSAYVLTLRVLHCLGLQPC